MSRRGRLAANLAYASAFAAAGVVPDVPGLATVVPDGVAHAIAVGLQVVMLYWLVVEQLSPAAALAVSCTAAFAFGIAVELLQLLTPTRHPQLSDVAADAVGALVAGCFIALLPLCTRRRPVDHGAR